MTLGSFVGVGAPSHSQSQKSIVDLEKAKEVVSVACRSSTVGLYFACC
jgi:hypothetical protein